MNILVTGSSGFIGRALYEAMLAEGHTVRAFDIVMPADDRHDRRSDFILGDIRDSSACRQAVQDIDVILHNAALCSLKDSLKNPSLTFDVNVKGTETLLAAAAASGVKKVVFASTAKLYGEPGDYVCKESDLANPLTPYAKSKYEAELCCKRFAHDSRIPIIALRLFSVYGPRQTLRYGLMGVILSSLLKSQKEVHIAADRLMLRDFVYIDDVILAHKLCLHYEPAGFDVFNIASGTSYAAYEVIHLVQLISGRQIHPVYQKLLEGMIMHMRASIDKARVRFGFTPRVTLEEGILKTINWVTSLLRRKE